MSEGGGEGESEEAMERQHKLKYFQLIFTDTREVFTRPDANWGLIRYF